ncbi:hypothetical protein BHM03_00034076 [Ensete ventricosum]|nr:hypothetical protein BHM03_00034076 [Ensete ventricosum]
MIEIDRYRPISMALLGGLPLLRDRAERGAEDNGKGGEIHRGRGYQEDRRLPRDGKKGSELPGPLARGFRIRSLGFQVTEVVRRGSERGREVGQKSTLRALGERPRARDGGRVFNLRVRPSQGKGSISSLSEPARTGIPRDPPHWPLQSLPPLGGARPARVT